MIHAHRLNNSQPIIKPRPGISWESKGICNPGAIIHNNKIYLLYRAFDQHTHSSFGLASSEDAIHFTFASDKPAFTKQSDKEYEKDGIENPRITTIENTHHILYTSAARYDQPGQTPDHIWKTAVCLATTQDFATFDRQGMLLNSGLDKDAALFPEKIDGWYYMHHRTNELNIGLSRSQDLKNWEQITDSLMTPISNEWENERVSIGPPPIKTAKGWLSFYHGRNQEGIYSISAFLASLHDPSHIQNKLTYPILQPEFDYEKNGSFPNVVYTCGAIEKGEEIYIYYGSADYSIGLASINTEQLLSELA